MTERVATYERVSTEIQRERETILTQYEMLKETVAALTNVEVVGRYMDDGVSGMLRFHERPDGARLLQDAKAGVFDTLWVYEIDRLGRDGVEPLVVWRDLADLGIRVFTLYGDTQNPIIRAVLAAMAAEERSKFLVRTYDGLTRAARAGRYCGGIVPMGYRVEGLKQTARYVPDDQDILANGWTAADVIRHIFDRVANHRWSTYQVADELNALAIPTHYVRDGRAIVRGKRKGRTAGIWRPSKLRVILGNSMYRGVNQYRKRSKRAPIVEGVVPALVDDETWFEAQEVLRSKRLIPASASITFYLLRSRIRCAECDSNYCGTKGSDRYGHSYRCNGALRYKARSEGPCKAKALPGRLIDSVVWNDIESFLRNPGQLLEELAQDHDREAEQARLESELASFEQAVARLDKRIKNLALMRADESIGHEEYRALRSEAEIARSGLLARRADVERQMSAAEQAKPEQEALLARLRERLDQGLTDEERREIVGLLVEEIVVTTHREDARKAQVHVRICYRFPETSVVPAFTGTDYRQTAAKSSPGT